MVRCQVVQQAPVLTISPVGRQQVAFDAVSKERQGAARLRLIQPLPLRGQALAIHSGRLCRSMGSQRRSGRYVQRGKPGAALLGLVQSGQGDQGETLSLRQQLRNQRW